MAKRSLVKIKSADEHYHRLKGEMEIAQEELRKVEAILGEEQAAVNAFRMHCRLKLGPWVDQIIDLYSEKQRIIIHREMRQQAKEQGNEFNEDEWLEDRGIDLDDELPLDGLMEEANLPYDINTSDEKMARKIYRDLARKHHPDMAEGAMQKLYATSMMAAVNEAYARKDTQALLDLAGELDPKTAEELSKSASKMSIKARKLQQQLRRCKQRKRRVTLQLRSLREETISKLWRRAQSIDKGEGENWWDEVAQSLQAQIEGYKKEISQLRGQLQ
ncbi:MAG: J domain-containing protein [Chloroflexota bacterium]